MTTGKVPAREDGSRAGSARHRLLARTRLASWIPVILLVVVMLGPSLLGLRLFGAGDLMQQRAPWVESSTVEEVTNQCVSDTVDGTIPTLLSFRDRIADGDLAPLWDNAASAGTMLAAAPPQGVSSPIVVAALPFPEAAVTAWIKLFEIALIMAGTVAWGRRLGLSTGAGVIGGFLYATGSFMVMWTNWPQTRTAAFFPLVFWAVERLVQDRTLRSALPFPLVIAGMVLGGFPAIAVHTVYLAAAYALLRLVVINRQRRREVAGGGTGANRGWWPTWGKAPALAVGGGVVAVALVAFQLVPWLNQLSGTDLEYRQNLWQGTFGAREILTAAYPQALGTCAEGLPRWGSVIPVEGVSFVGAGALVLCLAALVLPVPSDRARGVRIFLLLAGGLGFAVTFLGGTVNYLVHLLPLMDNSPLHRMRGVGSLMLAMLAAFGFEAVRRSRGERRWLPWLGVVAAPVLLVAAALGARSLAPGAGEWSLVRFSVLVGLACGLGVSAAWAWIMAGLRGSRSVAALLIPVLLALDGLMFTNAFWPRTEPELLYPQTSTDTFLRENLGDERMVGVSSAYWGGAGQVSDIRSLSGHIFVPPEWRDLLLQADPNMFITPTYHTLSNLDSLTSPVLDRFAVSHAVLDTNILPPGPLLGDGEQDRDRGVSLQDVSGGRTVEAGTPLRAAVVELASPIGDVAESQDPAHIVVEVVAADGTVLAEGERRVRDGAQGLFAVPVAGEHLETAGAYEVRVRAEGGQPVSVVGAGPAAPQSGEAWVGVVAAPDDDDLNLVDAAEAQVYERPTALPRFRWASDVAACASAEECAALMGEVPDRTVLLDPGDADGASFGSAPAEVAVEADTDDYQRVRVDAEGDGMLVIADAYQPDWVARVDGEVVPMMRADHAMKGVPVPAGTHTVEISYEPAGWGVLPWVSLVTLVGLLGGWTYQAVVRPRKRTAGAGEHAV